MKPPAKPRTSNRAAKDYRHKDEALLRPESGAQDNFPAYKQKPPKTYRYDSSLAPEMQWDENKARDDAEELIDQILKSDDLKKAQEAARELRQMGAPFLDWAGKAERGKFSVPTLPLFTHERLSTHAVLETLKRRHPARQATLEMFNEGDKSISDKISGAYEHQNGWQNRGAELIINN